MDFPQAIVSIVILCICVLIGIPLWWNTTKVYRADLPYQKISLLESTSINLNCNIEIFVANSLGSSTNSLKADLLDKLSISSEFSYLNVDIHFSLIEISSRTTDLEDYCQLLDSNISDLQKLSFRFLIAESSSERVKYYCKASLKTIILMSAEEDASTIVMDLLGIYLSHNEVTTHVLKSQQSTAVKSGMPPSEAYRLTFTLAIADPSDIFITWDIQTAIKKYLNPVLEKVNFMGPFHVSSQVLYYADVKVKPLKDGQSYYYPKAKLPLLINPLELRLSTYTTTDVGLNFIVYVPPRKRSPLFIKSKKSDKEFHTAFHSPRWGGIQFFSPDYTAANSSHVTLPMERIMETFVTHFKVLAGFNNNAYTQVFPQNQNIGVPHWIKLKLLLKKTYEHINKCVSTLSSLSRLLDEISNIVIRDEIKELIETAVNHVGLSQQYLRKGVVEKAYTHSKEAFVASEKAFYDSTLLSLLYFPDDQKYAIYVPLFLPIALPIVLSFVKAVKWLKKLKN